MPAKEQEENEYYTYYIYVFGARIFELNGSARLRRITTAANCAVYKASEFRRQNGKNMDKICARIRWIDDITAC